MTLAERFRAVKSDKAIELKDIKCLKQESLKCNLLVKNLVKEGVYQKRAFVVEMCL